ncbi:hypothetical protein D3P07_03890 [Paenibacillus sp. 1011MAR3C5]|uniref:hypothetical protein n=1 Tax=Paenibacillus sp. 1011MAR3C5 TaxID=1675787 RepID=UPI000E6C9E6C|nr:hypothetical protein [Paenibacillus sp. 1011MAR3C5]RJE91212.1 hypothetical protein D3P07_03890 [Paenibacillus sp. 1011MAR3C5]
MKGRLGTGNKDVFIVYVVPAWKWKEFIAFELIGGIAFYLIGKILTHSEWFSVAANMAGPQMLKNTYAALRIS